MAAARSRSRLRAIQRRIRRTRQVPRPGARSARLGAFVLLAALALPAPALAQDPRPSVLLVLDASRSMNAPAGDASGRSRLDAAKDAVDAVLGAVPPGAPMGMRVYGARVAGQGRAAACADTELVAPVARGDRGGLRAAAQALTGKGRTPIGASLLATPGDFPADGRRHQVVLVSDGLDNCSPPAPCQAARRVARRGVELTISVVGFQLDARARRQMRCIARVGGGTYVDATTPTGCARSCSPRSRAPSAATSRPGRRSRARRTRRTPPRLGAGLYQGELRAGAPQSFAVELAPGERLFAAATLIPPADLQRLGRVRPRAARRRRRAGGDRGDRLQRARHRRRADADADRAHRRRRARSRRRARASTSSGSRSRARASATRRSRSSSRSRRSGRTSGRAWCATPGRSPSRPPPRRRHATPTPAATPAADDGGGGGRRRARRGGARRPRARARGRARAVAEARMRRAVRARPRRVAVRSPRRRRACTPAVGGGSFNAAPLLEPGIYRDTVLQRRVPLLRHPARGGPAAPRAGPDPRRRPGDLARGRRSVHDQPAHAAARGRHAGRRRGRGRQRQHERGDRRHRPRVGAAAALGLLRPACRAVRGGRGEQLDLRGPRHLVRVAAPGLGRRRRCRSSCRSSWSSTRTARRRTSRPTPGPRRRRRRPRRRRPPATASGGAGLPALLGLGAAGLAAGLVLARVLARR